MRISDWSSDVCSSDLLSDEVDQRAAAGVGFARHDLRTVAGEGDAEPAERFRPQRDRAARQHHQGIAAGLGAECREIVFVAAHAMQQHQQRRRSEEHTSELQSLMRISYAVFCLKKKNKTNKTI